MFKLHILVQKIWAIVGIKSLMVISLQLSSTFLLDNVSDTSVMIHEISFYVHVSIRIRIFMQG